MCQFISSAICSVVCVCFLGVQPVQFLGIDLVLENGAAGEAESMQISLILAVWL